MSEPDYALELTEDIVLGVSGNYAPPTVPDYWPHRAPGWKKNLESLTDEQWVVVRGIWDYRQYVFDALQEQFGEGQLLFWQIMGGLPDLLSPIDDACQALVTFSKHLPQSHRLRQELEI